MTQDPSRPRADRRASSEIVKPDRETTNAAFREYLTTGSRRIRNEIVEQHRHLADLYANRYRSRGVPVDDLRQVGLLALVRAADRFDPDRGIEFATFASRTVEGELKRHFRDRSWSVRPPRRLQELHLDLRRTEEDLQHQLGRSPTVHELAAALDETVDHVLEALEASGAHDSKSLDQPADDESGHPAVDAVVSRNEPGFEHITDTMVVDALIEQLPERERRIVRMRFYDNMSQPEIAAVIGVSQSYLSRILRQALSELRERARGTGFDTPTGPKDPTLADFTSD